MVDYHAVEEGKDHGEIGLRWFGLISLMNMSRGLLEKD